MIQSRARGRAHEAIVHDHCFAFSHARNEVYDNATAGMVPVSVLIFESFAESNWENAEVFRNRGIAKNLI